MVPRRYKIWHDLTPYFSLLPKIRWKSSIWWTPLGLIDMSPRDDGTVPFVRRLARGLGGREGMEEASTWGEYTKNTIFVGDCQAPRKFSDFLKSRWFEPDIFPGCQCCSGLCDCSMLQRCLNLKSVSFWTFWGRCAFVSCLHLFHAYMRRLKMVEIHSAKPAMEREDRHLEKEIPTHVQLPFDFFWGLYMDL